MKHIIGLTLFSFIVSATAVVYAFFNVPEIVPVSEVTLNPSARYVPAERTHCKMRDGLDRSTVNSLTVTQAIFDLKTKQLNWEVITSAADADSIIALHFFVKNKNGTRYLNSTVAPISMKNENVTLKGTSSPEWLGNLGSYENLYVTAEHTTWKKLQDKTVQPKFDADKATPVLLYSGE